GGNIAGVTAATEIRKMDPAAQVSIYTKEAYPYYYRPKLWEIIAGNATQEEIYYRQLSWYADQGIQLHLNTTVEQLDAGAKTLTLDTGEVVSYDRLLIAAGSHCFVPPVKGADLPNVFSLRNMDDTKAIVECADRSKEAVLIGGGLLGLETAKALSDRGLHVSVVEFFPILLPRQLDAEGAAVLTHHLEGFGMTLLTDQVTESITQNESKLHVSLKSGIELDADMVIFSTGIRSNCGVWQAAGVETNRGLLVNEFMETNLPDVFAAGDVAEFEGIVYGIIPVAREQAKAAAQNMVKDRSSVYPGTVPSTRLKIAGLAFNALGESTLEGADVTVLRLSKPQEKRYERLAIKGGKVVGAIVFGDNSRSSAFKNLISDGTDVSAVQDQLFDDGFDLKSLQ
ncbi:MAG: FAD-dependent oxidoreductase, partial [Anaerolineae bacterium]|nr:FAD-dependent oxidoreductase [Anaerolineae bacterium]